MRKLLELTDINRAYYEGLDILESEPSFDENDARYSLMQWLDVGIGNAYYTNIFRQLDGHELLDIYEFLRDELGYEGDISNDLVVYVLAVMGIRYKDIAERIEDYFI